MRRTISNLSRELGVSRPRVYRAMERLGISKKSGGEIPLDEWNTLKEALAFTAHANSLKKADAVNLRRPETSSELPEDPSDLEPIIKLNRSTLHERLSRAKQEYDYNRSMIFIFQKETMAYLRETGKTTVMSHNGTMTAIPSIVNLEKYVKLNISLSKLISDIESDLDLSVEDGDDPFG